MLYIVATPIGNLEDITLRALKILSSCDYILAEDTRKSNFLLNHFKIYKKKVFSFYKFNEKRKEGMVLKDLEEKKDIALISDSGTPIISDPGFSLVKACREKNIEVTSIPGACSIINSLVLSGMDPIPFQFMGFLERKKAKEEKQIKKILSYEGTTIFFESPKRVLKTLKIIESLAPERNILIARELTKKFEEVLLDKASNLIKHFSKKSVKGEVVLLIEKLK